MDAQQAATFPKGNTCITTTQLRLKRAIWLSCFGALLSLYLFVDHYNTSEHSYCDLGTVISCSIINRSSFSELFGVPIALFGVLWFAIEAVLAWQAYHAYLCAAQKAAPAVFSLAFLLWTCIGTIFVFYLLFAEYLLGAICPMCTIIHCITLVLLYWAVRIWFDVRKRPPAMVIYNTLWTWGVVVLLIFLLLIALFHIGATERFSPEDKEAVCRCASAKGVIVFGSAQCSHCRQQKKVFGDAFRHLHFVECDNNPQCTTLNITVYPTWVLEEDGVEKARWLGVIDVQQLRELAGCK